MADDVKNEEEGTGDADAVADDSEPSGGDLDQDSSLDTDETDGDHRDGGEEADEAVHDDPAADDDLEPEDHGADVVRLTVDGRQVVLIGTAHISQESVDTVQRVITAEQPDLVCVELDERRYEALSNPKWWENLDLFQVIKSKQVPLLIAQLVLASQQKRMGMATNVKPGAELAAAVNCAKEHNIEFALIDREIRTTLLRAWRMTSLWKKNQLFASLVGGFFFGEEQEISEDAMRKLRERDTLGAMLEEMGESQPAIKRVLVDERDEYMAAGIRNSGGDQVRKVVAVVGAAHVPGILRHLDTDPPAGAVIGELNRIPAKPLYSKLLPWVIPAIVIGLFIFGFLGGDYEKVKQAALAWVLANGVLAALGTIIARGHPLTVVAGFLAAPITSLNPTIGAGFVTALVQTWLAPPSVKDMERVGDDVAAWSGWWKNKLARIFLVFLLSSIGSSIGTFVAFGWLKDLLQF